MYKYDALTPEVLYILTHKGTERPFTGQYLEKAKFGTYLCRGCGIVLWRAEHQFTSHCGWPSFDDEVLGHVVKQPDNDGVRTEIICARCQGHLGHIFSGEHLTPKNLRYCINSVAIEFIADDQVIETEESILAGGCFWGVQHLLSRLPGVLKTEVGYIDGVTPYPSYEQVCEKNTGHFEAVRVIYDPTILFYENLLKYFFEIHDPGQTNGQGPDIGPQYLSAIFYFNEPQKLTAKTVIEQLLQVHYPVATQLKKVTTFWPAEDYHQQYYSKTKNSPYCHYHVKKF